MVSDNKTSIVSNCPVEIYFENTISSKTNFLAIGVINALLSVTATTFNFIALVVFIRKPHLRTASNISLASLCFADLLIGISVQPCAAAYCFTLVLHSSAQKISCNMLYVSGIAGYSIVGISFLMVCFVILERYFAICHTFRHGRLFTKKFVLTVCCVIWIISLLHISLTVVFHQWKIFNCTLIFFIVLAYVGAPGAYFRIMKVVSRIRAEERKRNKELLQNDKNQLEDKTERPNNSKATLLVTSIVSAILLCSFFRVVFALINSIAGPVRVIELYLINWSRTLAMFKSTLNPILFCYFNRDIRIELKKFIATRNRKVTIVCCVQQLKIRDV